MVDDSARSSAPDGGLQDSDPTFAGRDDGLSLRERQIEEILQDFLIRRENGEDPRIEDYLARFPMLSEDLARLLTDATVPPPPIEPGEEVTVTGLEPPMEVVRSRIGPYEINEHVASGGGGTVYRTRHHKDGHEAALKVLHGPALGSLEDFDSFQREADLLRSLNLVNVIPVYETGVDHGRFFIATKWIEGATLSDHSGSRATAGRALAQEESARLIAQIARTMDLIHKHGILHRDIKPSNILVDATGEPILIDFGIARSPGDQSTADHGGPVGTPRYLAPELLDPDGRVSELCDVYGLGLCLFEIVTGTVAFPQKDRTTLFSAISQVGIPDVDALTRTGARAPLAAIIRRACHRDPKKRYATMEAFAADLERFIAGTAPEAETLRSLRPWTRALIRNRRLVRPAVAAALVIVLALGGLGVSSWVRANRIADLSQALDPFAFATIETFPGDAATQGRLAATAEALAREEPEEAIHRVRAAWIPYLMGDFEKALEYLGTERDVEEPAVHLFRAYVRQLIEDLANSGGEVRLPISHIPVDPKMPGGSRSEIEISDMVPVRVTGDVTMDGAEVSEPDESAEKRRRRLRPLSPDAARKLCSEVPPSASPVAAMVAAHILWMSLPGDLPAKESVAPLALLEAYCGRALEGGHLWARYLRGSARMLYGDPSQGTEDIATVFERHGGIGAVAYLHAVGLALTGDARAPSALARVADLRDQQQRPNAKILGWWALHALEKRRKSEMKRVLARWEAAPGDSWQQRVFPLLLEARFDLEVGNPVQAMEKLEYAVSEKPEYAIPYQELARIERDIMKDAESARRWEIKASAAAQQWPASIERFLTFNYFGLRPHCNKIMFTTRFVQLQPSGK